MKKRNFTTSKTYIRRNLDTLCPTAEDASSNLRNVLAQATDDEWTEGYDWYLSAHDVACTIAPNATVGAGILAALSPSTSWDDNLDGAAHVCETGTAWNQQCDLFNQRALAILDGASPLATLGGKKVRSFYKNILEPWRIGPITVDRHAFAVLMGRPLRSDDKRLERKGMYVWCAAVYRAEGRRLGVPPQCVQAVAWLTWRRLYSEAFRAQHRYDLDDLF